MKRIITSALLIATVLSLAACSNNKSASPSTEKKDKTTVIAKNKVTKKKTPSTKKKSSKKSDQKNTDKANQQAAVQNNTQQNNTDQQAQSQTSNQSQQASGTSTNNQQPAQNTQQQASGISYDENTLTGFLNKYGVSPVLYKTQHGMSTINALESTPDNMKTFGEQQLQTGMEQGYIDQNGNYTGPDYSGQ